MAVQGGVSDVVKTLLSSRYGISHQFTEELVETFSNEYLLPRNGVTRFCNVASVILAGRDKYGDLVKASKRYMEKEFFITAWCKAGDEARYFIAGLLEANGKVDVVDCIRFLAIEMSNPKRIAAVESSEISPSEAKRKLCSYFYAEKEAFISSAEEFDCNSFEYDNKDFLKNTFKYR